LDDGARVEVLWPPAQGAPTGPSPQSGPSGPPADARPATQAAWGKGLSVNDTSLVLRVVDAGGSILLPGDATEIPQAALLAEDASRLRCDVLVMPHHGSWSESLPEFLKAARPRVVLVSRASEPRPPASGRTAAAAADFYSRIKSADTYFSTAHSGWVRASLDPGDLQVHTMLDER
jgi:competence protein ComEC